MPFLENRHSRVLAWAVRHKLTVVAAGLGALVLTFGAFRLLPREFLPDEDKGYVFMIVFAPEGATSEYTDRFIRQAEQIVSEYPDTEAMLSAVALARGAPGESDFGVMFVDLKEDKRRSALALARPGAPGSMFMRLIQEIKGAQAITMLPKATELGEQYQLVLQGPDLERLERVATQVRLDMARVGILAQPRLNLNFEQPQLSVRIDRDLAANLGVQRARSLRSPPVALGRPGRRALQSEGQRV